MEVQFVGEWALFTGKTETTRDPTPHRARMDSRRECQVADIDAGHLHAVNGQHDAVIHHEGQGTTVTGRTLG